MKQYISVVTFYTLGTAVAGLAVMGVCIAVFSPHAHQVSLNLPLNSPWNPVSWLVLLGLYLVGSRLRIRIPEGQNLSSTHDVSTVAVFAAVVLLPSYIAILIIGIGGYLFQFGVRTRPVRRAFRISSYNTGMGVLQVAASALVFSGFGGQSLIFSPNFPADGLRLAMAVLGSGSVGYVVSYGLTMVDIAIIERGWEMRSNVPRAKRKRVTVTMRQAFARSHRSAILPELTAAITGVIFGYLWRVNPPLAPLALLPLAVIYIAFENFIRLQELDRLKSNFITEVSHELRTPLSAILAASDLLYHHADRLESNAVKELSRSSYESSNHLFRLVENLLNASTLQSGTLDIHPVSVSLDEIVEDASQQVQPFLESKQQSLKVDVPADLPEVLADPAHISQVLVNLLTNASKYSDSNSQIFIECTPHESFVRIAVVDLGVGIPEAEQAHIFERFYRVPANTMTSVVGSGLGLTIVKSLVEMHRGSVGVSSQPGSGSTFWFTLPTVPMAGA